MALSWNEIKKRAIEFSKSWEGVEREKAEAQTFWNEFFEVFGQTRRKVAILEQEVKRLDQSKGYIDLFWPKVLLAEAKSKGKDLVKAKEQAISYLHGIEESELPKYILTSDFDALSLLDLETGESWLFKFSKLHENIKLFGFIAGYTKTDFKVEDEVNIKAAELMGKLHDSLFAAGYNGHSLEVFLVRVLFCLFADDTGIFDDKGMFAEFIRNKTKIDGTDMGPQLAQLFQVLNTPESSRFKNLDEDLLKFPYVNGKLFEESIPLSSFDSDMRTALSQCSSFDWSKISPAVFGSLFQSVMDQQQRRNLGAHYTSEANILKVIRPLFLDELWEEFKGIKNNKNRLNEFHLKLARLKFLDPACGCGNFLVVTYRELRLLELEILKVLHVSRTIFDISELSLINVDQMYGIEIEEFPAKIAEVAMWLVDHQMNVKLSEQLGQYYVRLPLRKSANITNGNALRLNWKDIVPKTELSYILGNPPFVGERYQDETQREELTSVFGENVKLDYVSGWYYKAAEYANSSRIKIAYVSTNSVCQGEQVSILWQKLFNKFDIKIHFAHRTFKWNSEARGKAAVQVVIIGFATFDSISKWIYEYEDISGEPHIVEANNINAYLVDAKDVFINRRSTPFSEAPKMQNGSRANDRGLLLFDAKEREVFIELEPKSLYYFKRVIGGTEFINNKLRYTLWLENVNPTDLSLMPNVLSRISEIKKFRPDNPQLYSSIRKPKERYIFIPQVSSELRNYIPIGLVDPEIIPLDPHFFIDNATNFHFGILTSNMHMTWMRYIAGRLKSDYRYSNTLVYNNFPWPENITDAQKQLVEAKAQQVLDVRAEFSTSTLADLYNPLTMPPKLLKAHKELDSAVDKCFRSKPFTDERERIEFLFERYEELIFSNDK